MKKYPSDHLDKKTAESAIWFTTVPLIMQIVRFANSILLARLLSPKDFGIVGVASILVYYTNNLSNFGLGNAIVQRKDITDEHLNTFFSLNLAVSVFLCIIFMSTSSLISVFFRMKELNTVIKIFSSIFIITSFYTVAYTHLRRQLDFRAIALNEGTKVLVSIPVSLMMAFYGYGYWALIAAMLISTLIATISICLRAKISFHFRFSLKSFSDLLHYASWNFISVQVRLLSEYLDKLIIGKIAGATVLGYYEKAFGIAQMPYEQMANKLGSIAFSTFSRHQDAPHELRYYFRRMLTLLTFLALPTFLGLHSVAKPFVAVLLGKKWIPMVPTFQILLVAFMVSSLASLFSTLNITCGNYKRDICLRAVCLIGLLAILPFAAMRGIETVAFAVLGHNLLFLALAFNLTRRVVPLTWGDASSIFLPALAGSLLMLVSIASCSALMSPPPSLATLAILTLTGAATYLAWFYCTRFKEWQFLRNKMLLIYTKAKAIITRKTS
ncbi:MAG: lipopolysaccharide biosynthesis protein [Thermodesulfobacteriota bacterium]